MNVVIVQARMGSSRLPGKVMMDLNGLPVFQHVYQRVSRIPGVDQVCFAIPDSAKDDPLAQELSAQGLSVVRGSENDVLARYLKAARATNADTIMRVTCDCPLIDPGVSGRVLSEFLSHTVDYASNVDPRTWPRGLDTEVFSRDALERMAAEASSAYDREHVTPWLRSSAGIERHNVSVGHLDYANWRWTLDYPQDLEFLRAILEKLPIPSPLVSFEQLADAMMIFPELGAINSHLT